MSIRWRLTLWYSSILGVILLVFGISLYFFFVQTEMKKFDRHLFNTGQEVIGSIKVVNTFPLPIQRLALPDMDIFAAPEIYLQVVDPRGRIVTRSRSLANESLPLSQNTVNAIVKGEDFYETVTVKGVKIRIYSIPIIYDNQIMGLLQVGDSSLDRIEGTLVNLKRVLFIGTILTLIIAGSSGWLLAKRALKPIGMVTKSASEIQEGKDLERRISYDGPADEIGLLIRQINGMLARLEGVYQDLDASYQMQKRFVSDASHELRTPLTSMRGNIDFLLKVHQTEPAMIEEVLHDLSQEIERLTRMINNLLALARADAGFHLEMEEINLSEFIEEIVVDYHKRYEHSPLNVNDFEEMESLTLFGNHDFLTLAINSLLENAHKYGEGAEVRLTIKLESNKQYITIMVTDDGIGIPADDLPHIFSRFYRGHNTRGMIGTGLGLPITRWIIEQHGGEITVLSDVGEGTTFTVRLPILNFQ